MFDPAIDNPELEWCYGGRTTTVLGTAFQPNVTQFTFDGSLFCPENAELHFFTGADDTPVFARQRNWLYGWLPVVEYEWQDGDLHYRLEAFGAALDGIGAGNVVHFTRLSVRNHGKTEQNAALGAALRGSGLDYRDGKPSAVIQSDDVVAMDAGAVTVNKALSAIYCGDGLQLERTLGLPYDAPFTGFDAGIRVDTSYAIARRTASLAPGASIDLTAVIPRKRIGDGGQIATVKAADYEIERAGCIAFWKGFFKRGAIRVPEARVEDSYRASLVHLALATRSDDGVLGKRQGSGLPYPRLFLNDYIDMMMAWVRSGHPDMHQHNVQWLKDKQLPDSGMFIDVHNRGKDHIVTSHGQAIIALAYPPVFAGDVESGRDVFEHVRKGVELIIRDHRSGKHHGLLRPSIPYDAPMLTGLHACHNFFALTGMRLGIRLAGLIGETDIAAAWGVAEKSYAAAIKAACEDSFKREGWVRSGFYDWTAGYVQGRVGRTNSYPNQDWENMLMAYPTELYGGSDKILTDTLDMIRRRKYREGVMTYRNGMHIHQYVTINMAHQFLAGGQQEKALEDLYHILLHNGPTHEGFENLVEPWTDRTPRANCPPPHAWAASKIGLFLRNMMVLEYGGRLGMDAGQRDLHLFNLISPAWQRTGESLGIDAMPTEFGDVSASFTFVAGGAEVRIQPDFRQQPNRIVLRIPYFVELTDFSSDAVESERQGDQLFFSPDVKTVGLRWKPRPEAHKGAAQRILTRYRSEYPRVMNEGEYEKVAAPAAELSAEEQAWPAQPLSFALVRKTFAHEYRERFRRFVAAGRQPQPVAAPPLKKAVPADNPVLDVPSRTTNAPTSASRNQEYARFAANGNRSNPAFYWTAERPDDWWQVSLPDNSEVSQLTIVARSADKSQPQPSYMIEYSQEGGMWHPLVDRSGEVDAEAPAGSTHHFAPVKLRYIRVRFPGAGKKAPMRLLELIVP